MPDSIPLTPVESSNVEALGYDEATQELHIQFKGGGLYIYEQVPEEVHDQITRASSIGRAIQQLLKPSYTFRRG